MQGEILYPQVCKTTSFLKGINSPKVHPQQVYGKWFCKKNTQQNGVEIVGWNLWDGTVHHVTGVHPNKILGQKQHKQNPPIRWWNFVEHMFQKICGGWQAENLKTFFKSGVLKPFLLCVYMLLWKMQYMCEKYEYCMVDKTLANMQKFCLLGFNSSRCPCLNETRVSCINAHDIYGSSRLYIAHLCSTSRSA